MKSASNLTPRRSALTPACWFPAIPTENPALRAVATPSSASSYRSVVAVVAWVCGRLTLRTSQAGGARLITLNKSSEYSAQSQWRDSENHALNPTRQLRDHYTRLAHP